MGVRAASRAYRRPRTAGKGQNLVGLRIWRAQPRKIPRNARRSETGPWGGQNRLWYFSEKTPHRHRQSRTSARLGSPLWKAQELLDFTLGSHGRQIDRTRHARIHHQPRQGGSRDHVQEESAPRGVCGKRGEADFFHARPGALDAAARAHRSSRTAARRAGGFRIISRGARARSCGRRRAFARPGSRFPTGSSPSSAASPLWLTTLALPRALSPTGEEVRPQGHEDRGRARGRQAQQAHLV